MPYTTIVFLITAVILFRAGVTAQSGRYGGYSESVSRSKTKPPALVKPDPKDDTIRVETDLVTIPVRVTSKDSRSVADLKRSEFRIYENGVEQEIAYFSSGNEPFTVALLLDMSYSTVFKLAEIQAAALLFVSHLKPEDKVIVIGFDEKPHILCRPTNDTKVLKLAIEGATIGSGTSLYDTLGLTIGDLLEEIKGRRSIVILTDGVDTKSSSYSSQQVLKALSEEDLLVYPIRYDTYADVRKSRKNNAEIRYDDDDRPYVVEKPPEMGEREADYAFAAEFLDELAYRTGGSVFRVNNTTNLNSAFGRIADELRKSYSLGYYPSEERRPGAEYTLKVRIYRPNLLIRTREGFSIGLK